MGFSFPEEGSAQERHEYSKDSTNIQATTNVQNQRYQSLLQQCFVNSRFLAVGGMMLSCLVPELYILSQCEFF